MRSSRCSSAAQGAPAAGVSGGARRDRSRPGRPMILAHLVSSAAAFRGVRSTDSLASSHLAALGWRVLPGADPFACSAVPSLLEEIRHPLLSPSPLP